MELSQLKLGSIDDLVCAGTAGRAFDVDSSNKKIEGRGKGQDHGTPRRYNLGLDVGEAAGREEGPDALANLIAIKRLSGFLCQQLQQMLSVAIRDSRKLNGLNESSLVGGDSAGGKGRRFLAFRDWLGWSRVPPFA